MDYPPRGHITRIRPNHPPISDYNRSVCPEGSYEAMAAIARVGLALNPEWKPGTVERARQSDEGKPHHAPSHRARAIDCPRCGEVKYTRRILTTVCDGCRADHDRELRLGRQRRAVERRANERHDQ